MTDLEQITTLLIEDNPGDARLIEEFLKESFLEFQPAVEVVETLEQAIRRLQDRKFDFILLDLSLPDSFGLDTFDAVQEAAETIPIIVLTGLDDELLGVDAVQAGAQDFLRKNDLDATLLGRSILYAIQRNQLSRKLEQSQERLLEAQRLAHLGNFEQNLETGELIWSDELFRIFDMDPEGEEPSFEELMEMVHPEDRGLVETAIEKVRQGAEQQYIELGITTKAGNTKYIYNIINPIEIKEGVVDTIFGTTHDITERTKAEERLKEQERRYRMLFQGTTDEILVFQIDENNEPMPFLEVNDIACNILGYSRKELLQKTLYDIVAADKEEVQERITDLLDKRKRVHESQHMTKQGQTIPLEISARLFYYNGHPTVISIGRDVRERHKLEQEILNISEQERQRIGREMHDHLGQMLTGIGLISQNLADTLESEGSEYAKKVQEIADIVKEADEHARALARGLVPVNVESNGLAHALKELTQNLSDMHNIDIRYSNFQKQDKMNNSTAVHLYRIAQEAINNAIKHANPTAIEVELNSRADHLTLRVEDDGQGFPDAAERGDGMGVRIMHFRAQMIGGKLEINSESGEGTEVCCQMPL